MPSKESKQLFLAVLKNGFSIARAAEAVGLTRQQALDLRAKDLAFAADWDNAVETAVDALEDIATSRAKATNDKLLELLLKARRPEVYARPEATTTQTVTVVMPTLEDLKAKYKELGLEPPVIEGDFVDVRRLSKPETHE
jgi:hypothetical protein